MEEAVEMAKTFKEFAYAVSHDLGTPLRAVVEFSRMLKEENHEALAGEGNLYLSMIVENGEKAQTMLAALTEYSRLNTNAKPFAPVDLNHVVHESAVELVSKISLSGAKISFGPMPVLNVDGDQMRKLFTILLDNALTFHAPYVTPAISVSAKQEAREWIFSVIDNGIGIEARYIERIFLPFKRLHPPEEFPGVGMGLTLARKIVERHGGHIWVESTPGKGSTFSFSLPLAKSH